MGNSRQSSDGPQMSHAPLAERCVIHKSRSCLGERDLSLFFSFLTFFVDFLSAFPAHTLTNARASGGPSTAHIYISYPVPCLSLQRRGGGTLESCSSVFEVHARVLYAVFLYSFLLSKRGEGKERLGGLENCSCPAITTGLGDRGNGPRSCYKFRCCTACVYQRNCVGTCSQLLGFSGNFCCKCKAGSGG